MVTPNFESLKLRDESEAFSIETSDDLLQASVAMVSQVRRTLEIVSRNLDPQIYDTAAFADGLQKCVLGSHQARVRIIVMDSTPIVGRGHRLINLSQRLSTFIELRNPSRDHASFNSAFLIADRIGSIHRVLADRFEGVVAFNDARSAQLLAEQFEEMWAQATPDPNFRRLSL